MDVVCGWRDRMRTMGTIDQLFHRGWKQAAAVIYPVVACAHALGVKVFRMTYETER